MISEQWDTAQVCPNGHVANDSIETFPQFNKEYCEKCGEKTLTQCQSCDSPIAGTLIDSRVIARFDPPAYCRYCGNAFPWTARALDAAREMADELDSLSGDEKEKLKATFDDLASDTARTPLAVSRFRKFMDKIGKPAAAGLQQIIVSVATEAAKKSLGL